LQTATSCFLYLLTRGQSPAGVPHVDQPGRVLRALNRHARLLCPYLHRDLVRYFLYFSLSPEKPLQKIVPSPGGSGSPPRFIGPTRVRICTEISSKAAGRSTSVTHANSDDARQPVDIELTFIPVRHKVSIIHSLGGSVAEWLACWTQAQ